MTQLLTFSDVWGGYGEMQVLHGVSGEFSKGSITAILGTNGAGKSTLLRLLSGQIFCHSGCIKYQQKTISTYPPHRRVNDGLVMVPEGRMIFPEMTVEENLRVSASGPRARSTVRQSFQRVYDLFPRLHERRTQVGGTLSGGEQQMLAIGRALMSCPEVILLDEPTLGLAPAVCNQIFDLINRLREEEVTIVIAEQDVAKTLTIADRAMVIANGKIVCENDAQTLITDVQLWQSFF